MIYRLIKKNNGIRIGQLMTRRGVVDLPTFMPVGTRGVVKSLMPRDVSATNSQIMLCNTYHLHLQPGEDVVSALGGLHQFTNWNGPILTDSGGFQVFSLAHSRKITEEGVEFKDPKSGSKIFISPEISMQIQIKLGSDIIMAFDDLTGLDGKDKHRSFEAQERTHRWLVRSLSEFKKLTKDMPNRPHFFGIIQGGLDHKLRIQSAEFIQSLDVDGVAIGGLSVGETRSEMFSIIDLLEPVLDPERPHYLMGVGDPIDVRYAIEHGIDMMDCVMPTRNARHGTVWVSGDKKMNLKNKEFEYDSSPIMEDCDCYSCQEKFSKGFLRHELKSNEPLAGGLASIHNIRYLQRICEELRNDN